MATAFQRRRYRLHFHCLGLLAVLLAFIGTIHQQTELWPDDFLSCEGVFSSQAHHARFPETKKNFPAGRFFAASMGILVVQPSLDFLMDGAPFLARLFQRDEPLCSRCPASVFLAERPSASLPLTFQALYFKRRSSLSGSHSHATVNGIPLAAGSGQASSFASILRPIQNGVERLKVGDIHLSSLFGQMRRDALILFFRELRKSYKKTPSRNPGGSDKPICKQRLIGEWDVFIRTVKRKPVVRI